MPTIYVKIIKRNSLKYFNKKIRHIKIKFKILFQQMKNYKNLQNKNNKNFKK
jgi:hypothetical protein